MLVHLDVVIEADSALLPFRENVGLRGRGPQGGSLDLIEQVPAAGAEMPGHPVVQPVKEDADGGVQFRQREEPLVAQARRDPALCDLDGDFHLRLVAGLARSGRHDCRAVMRGHVGVGPVHCRFIKAGLGHAGLQVVAYHLRRDAAEVAERPAMRADPV